MKNKRVENMDIKIRNVVIVASFKQNFFLIDFETVLKKTSLDIKLKSNILTLKLTEPRSTITIFSSGKVVCTGVKSKREAKKAIRKIINTLKQNNIIILGEPDYSISNILASADYQNTIDLEKASLVLDNTLYEPEQAPNLLMRLNKPKVVFLIFNSGKVICTGSNSNSDVQMAFNLLFQLLNKNNLFY